MTAGVDEAGIIFIIDKEGNKQARYHNCNNMLGRRGKSFGPTVVAVFAILIGGYVYYLYNELNSRYQDSEGRLAHVVKKHTSLKSQLQVVYEHRTKLEAALIKERTDHRATKEDFLGNKKACLKNFTEVKHESMNRFNALDTEHKMLKAKYDEVSTDYSNMQQQYVRLTQDHQKIVSGQKEDFEMLKDTKDKESKSLQERVEYLYSEKEEQKAQATKYLDYYKSERNERVRLSETNTRLNEKISKSEEKNNLLENERDELKAKLVLTGNKIRALESKIIQLNKLQEEQEKRLENMKEAHEIIPTTAPIAITLAAPTKHLPTKGRTIKAVPQGANPKKMTNAPTKFSILRTTLKQAVNHARTNILQLMEKRELRPSDKVQQILIGKQSEGDTSIREDSIEDQYRVTEPPQEVRPQSIDKATESRESASKKSGATDTGIKSRPDIALGKREVLGDEEANGNQGIVETGNAVQDVGNSLDRKLEYNLKQQQIDDMFVGKNARKLNLTDSNADSAPHKESLDFENSESQRRRNEEVNSFMKKQLAMLQRPDEKKKENVVKAEEKAHFNDKSLPSDSDRLNGNIGKKSNKLKHQKQTKKLTKSTQTKSRVKNVDGGKPVNNQLQPPARKKIVAEPHRELPKIERKPLVKPQGHEELPNLARKPLVKPQGHQKSTKMKERALEELSKIDRKPLVKPDKKKPQKQAQVKDERLHVPIKKPQRIKLDEKVEDNEKDEALKSRKSELKGHEEDEVGDQDLDGGKGNEEDDKEKIDTDDESRTNNNGNAIENKL